MVGVVSCFITLVIMLVAVAFFIVLERKVLGGIQLRQGPNKPSFKGILQAVADGIKLISKGIIIPRRANAVLFCSAPLLMFILSFSIWLVFPSYYPSYYFSYSILFFVALSSVNVFGVILCGWSSNSSYAFLGAMRAVAQTVSYEVTMSTVIFMPLLFFRSLDFQAFQSEAGGVALLCLEGLLMWVICVIAETNRAPFDFVEGESELVAGFHVEVGGFFFALIALSEYGGMLSISLFSCVLFLGGLPPICLTLCTVLACMLFIVVRGSLPRYRYDKLMGFCWNTMLPLSMVFFLVALVLAWGFQESSISF